jgi:hypothetical protein
MEPLAALMVVLVTVAYLVNRLMVFMNAVRRDRRENGRDLPGEVERQDKRRRL